MRIDELPFITVTGFATKVTVGALAEAAIIEVVPIVVIEFAVTLAAAMKVPAVLYRQFAEDSDCGAPNPDPVPQSN